VCSSDLRVTRIARSHGRDIATPAEARAIIGLGRNSHPHA
jgi:hypothetical protein